MRQRSSRGLTLIELVVAMSIFALVAVLGVQSLTGTMRLRDRLAATAEETAGLGGTASLLRNDLSAAIALLFYPAGASQPRPAIDTVGDGQGFALSLGGQAILSGPGGGPLTSPRQRVEWRVDSETGDLVRRVWPSLYPTDAGQVSPDVIVMEGVQGLELRTYWTGHGWIAGPRPEGMSSARFNPADGDMEEGGPLRDVLSDALPLAMEVTLLTREHGRITVMETQQ